MLGEEVPPYLSLCGVRGLKQLAQELEASHPEVSAEIQRWTIHDEDLYRVTRKLSDLLDGRIKRSYDQLATISVVGYPSAASSALRSRRIF